MMDVEWIILADAAEVVNNKLYLVGGGWETITLNAELPVSHQCAVVAAFRVPWSEANRQHAVEIAIEDQADEPLAVVHGQIEVGRPPGVPLGQAQRVQMAVTLDVPFALFGVYAISARIEGEERCRVAFNVVPGPALAAPQQRWAS